MEKEITHKELLVAFANYGFRKASMEDLSRVAGVSRQTLYKRFKSKQAVLDWAVTGFVEARGVRVQACLQNPDAGNNEALLMFYRVWMGELAPLLNTTPHGMEIMGLSTDSLKKSGVNTHDDYETMISEFLISRGLCKDQNSASETYYLLTMAAKGILFKESSEDDFASGMKRVLETVFPT
ncbi:TetR/AcrR family transcriptional regulator [Sneathiella marina]|uniref:TetR/AcrR family transcriptional regulator n=1 Tax=Sneathiella marina TaxID=2950108 RepID=A0ABY4W6H4_9PROT|nr:TetR/AcrR family transcriptional regulator [Sneathiella marina]USG62461.1 TetR/AcrR family transcriptional regulator [Sneathiella marina]